MCCELTVLEIGRSKKLEYKRNKILARISRQECRDTTVSEFQSSFFFHCGKMHYIAYNTQAKLVGCNMFTVPVFLGKLLGLFPLGPSSPLPACLLFSSLLPSFFYHLPFSPLPSV